MNDVLTDVELNLDFPKKIMLEVSGMCNDRCIFCSNQKYKRTKKVVDDGLAIRIIKEAYDCGAREISFHGMGEPLICNRLKDYVALSKNLGYEYTYLDTNGALAIPDVINPIIDAGLDSIKFSISASNPEDYEKVQGRDDFDKVLDNLRKLSEYRKERGYHFKLIVGFVETVFTIGQFQELKSLIGSYVDDLWLSPCQTQGGTMNDEIEPIKLESNLQPPVDPIICREPFERLVVSSNGLIYACCMWDDSSDLVVGDASTDSLRDAWLSNKAMDIRRQHMTGVGLNDSCRRCDDYKLYQISKLNSEI